MKSIFLTGSSGFVGSYLLKYFEVKKYDVNKYNRKEQITLHEDVVINLAGKAHDVVKVSNASEYYKINTEFANHLFDEFLKSKATVYITLSSVKAVCDKTDSILTEDNLPNPKTDYGKSKLLAEQYILHSAIPNDKKVFILRPCMIHGPGNKGNLNLLFNLISKGFPWPLGAFDNKRSFCSIENLAFVLNELVIRNDIPSGIYNIADDEAISTNEVVDIISDCRSKKNKVWYLPKFLINVLAKTGDVFGLPFNTERLEKLTESFIVSNSKIKSVLKKPLPIGTKLGLIQTIKSFNI